MPRPKRRSGPKSDQHHTFVLDENFGHSEVPTTLRGLEHTTIEMLVPHHFKRGTPDAEWIPEVTKRGWIVITKDGRIRRRVIEIEAWKRAGATICVVTQGNLTGEQLFATIAKAMPKLRRRIEFWSEKPLIVGISAAANVYVKYGRSPRGNRRDWLKLDDDTAEAKSLHEGDDRIDDGRLPHPAHPKQR